MRNILATVKRTLFKYLSVVYFFQFHNHKVACLLFRDLSVIIKKERIEHNVFTEFKSLIIKHDPHIFFDIGANIGLYSWYFRVNQKNSSIFLFEPDLTNISLLQKTIRRNNIRDAKLFEGVISNSDKDQEFLIDEISGATGSLINDSKNPYSLHHTYGLKNTQTVKSTTLDSYCGRIDTSQNTVVKIDVEGAEHSVIEGGMRFFQMHKPFIIIETFDTDKLSPLIEIGYSVEKLDDRFNYLLTPE